MFEHSVRKHQIDRAIVEWEVVRRALLEPGIGESRVAGDVAGDVDLRLFAIHSQDRSTGSCRASDAHRDRARPASHIHHASYVGQEPSANLARSSAVRWRIILSASSLHPGA